MIRGFVRDTVVVEVQGVGYRASVPVSILAKAKEGDKIFLWTHLAVRENSQDLYGFETKEDLSWFELLLTVSGIGPKSALAILNAVDTKALERAISGNNPTALSSAFGVGKKTAEKICLELREKVGISETGVGERTSSTDTDAVDALVGLGYSVREARDAVRLIPKETEGTEARIREAIRAASRAR